MLLCAEDIHFSYEGNGKWALRGAGFRLPEGSIVGLVGPNGSGKSTLLRVLAGILRPQRGQVLFQGRDIRKTGRRHLARQIAFLPQSVQPIFPLSVREMVALGRFPHQKAMGFPSREDLDVIQECMERTEVSSLASRPLSTLSGGEQQRVLIASVLAQQPAVLLLDEPTSSLDIHHQVEICMLLGDLSKRNLGIVMVTHDLNLAARFCTSLVLLHDAAVAAQGAPAEVLKTGILQEIYRARVAVEINKATGTPMVTVLDIEREKRSPCGKS